MLKGLGPSCVASRMGERVAPLTRAALAPAPAHHLATAVRSGPLGGGRLGRGTSPDFLDFAAYRNKGVEIAYTCTIFVFFAPRSGICSLVLSELNSQFGDVNGRPDRNFVCVCVCFNVRYASCEF